MPPRQTAVRATTASNRDLFLKLFCIGCFLSHCSIKVYAFRKLYRQRSIKWPSETLQDFRQEPRPPFGLVNPDFDQTGGRHVVVLIASFVGRTEVATQRQIIGVELFEHLFRSDALIV